MFQVTVLFLLTLTESPAQETRIPKVEFDEASMEDLVGFLREGATGKARMSWLTPG